MLITFKGLSREVNLKEVRDNLFTGFVGSAWVAWNTTAHDLPYVRFKFDMKPSTPEENLKMRYLVKHFMGEYIYLTKGDTRYHFNSSCSESSDKKGLSKSPAVPHTSGVPEWMREDHKVWTQCFKKDGSFYFRRTRFNEDSKELVESYLPFCSKCPLRSTCNKPCAVPENYGSQIISK